MTPTTPTAFYLSQFYTHQISLRRREHNVQVVVMRTLPLDAETIIILVTISILPPRMEAIGFLSGAVMLNPLVPLELCSVVEVVAAEDAVEVFC